MNRLLQPELSDMEKRNTVQLEYITENNNHIWSLGRLPGGSDFRPEI